MIYPHPRRLALYTSVVVVFALILGAGAGSSHAPDPRFIYLVTLFALCASPIIDIDRLNGRMAMLSCFSMVYFVFFGVGDLTAALSGRDLLIANKSALTETESVILVGGLLSMVGYRWALRMASAGEPGKAARDWSESSTLIVGLALFIAGTAASWYLKVFVMPDKDVYAAHRLGELDPKLIAFLLLGDLVLPLGIIILSYAYAAFKRPYLLPLIVGVVLMQALTGFVTDEKAIVMKGGLIVLVALVLVNGKLPKIWLAGAVAFVILGYPVLTAFRAEVIGAQGLNHLQVLQNLGSAIKDSAVAAIDAKPVERVERRQDFFERANMKTSVELAVERCGDSVPFQHGATLVSILTAFVPRLLMHDKDAGDAGRVFGKEFRVSAYTDTYISPSHLGELYWNFGWTGVIVGMLGLGFLLGFIGVRCDFTEYRSVTRLLVFASTLYLLVWGFEASIAINYVVWMRGIAVIGALHLLLAHRPAERGSTPTEPATPPNRPAASPALFPNLLR
jgi:hypothetical protein